MSIFSDASLSNQSTVQQNKKKLKGSFYTSTRSDRSRTPAKRMLCNGTDPLVGLSPSSPRSYYALRDTVLNALDLLVPSYHLPSYPTKTRESRKREPRFKLGDHSIHFGSKVNLASQSRIASFAGKKPLHSSYPRY